MREKYEKGKADNNEEEKKEEEEKEEAKEFINQLYDIITKMVITSLQY